MREDRSMQHATRFLTLTEEVAEIDRAVFEGDSLGGSAKFARLLKRKSVSLFATISGNGRAPKVSAARG